MDSPPNGKRPGGEDDDNEESSLAVAVVPPPSKKARGSEVVVSGNNTKSIQETGPSRTSNLSSRIVQLSGHQGEVFTCKFHPDGEVIASSGFDRQLFLWSVYGDSDNPDPVNLASLHGHKGAILDLSFSNTDGGTIFTASTDKTVNVWDSNTYIRIKRLKGHSGIVNSVCHSEHLLSSGSDDCTIKVWDARIRRCTQTYQDKYQILSTAWNEGGNQVFFGGIENVIKVYDLRKGDILYQMVGHFDSITGLSLSPDGSYLLSNSMDNTLCVWDIRPYAPQERCVKTLHGHQSNFEKNLLRCSWSPDGSRVTAGSADRNVFIWEVKSGRILYKLPGHTGSVNECVFHPQEPIILSCSSDKTLFLGELENC